MPSGDADEELQGISVTASTHQDTPTEDSDSRRWKAVCPLDTLADDGSVHVDVAGYAVCLARSRGTVHALLDVCSHGQVALSDGDVEDGYIECWLHGSRFSLDTGVPTGPPATQPVPVYPVRVVGDRIEISLPAAPDDPAPC